MIKIFTGMLFIFLAHSAAAQQNSTFDPHHFKPPYHLPTPPGWSTEQFPIPIGFAPQINYSGVEDIRFAPGWSKADSSNYWTYAFLWLLDGAVSVDSGTINSNLTAYYTGLILINRPDLSEKERMPVVSSIKTVATLPGDVNSFEGSIQITNYLTAKPLKLYCKVHVKKCTSKNYTFIFYQLSPKEFSHHNWIALDQLWTNFKCNP